jgi:hypothetical protein
MSKMIGSTVKQPDNQYRVLRTDDLGNLCITEAQDGIPYGGYLTVNGVIDGNNSGVVDAHTTPVTLSYVATLPFNMHTMSITLIGPGTAPLTYNGYCGIAAGTIVNGIHFFITSAAGVIVPLLGGIGFKENSQCLSLSSSTPYPPFGDNVPFLYINFDLINKYGTPLKLATGDRISVVLSDNFSTLIRHTFQAQGVLLVG